MQPDPAIRQLITQGATRILPHITESDVRRSVVGLRPYRTDGLRIEVEEVDGKVIVHNYGHGGAGITLAWGSGRLALDKIK